MSQGAVILPGSPLSGTNLCADVNSAFAYTISQFSGYSAPTLGPGAASVLVAGQSWLNTTITQYVLSYYDGANWCPVATLDSVGHTMTVPGPWRNILSDNGGMEVWQRGAGAAASFTVAASQTQYTADRWYIATGANQASVVAAVAGLTNGSNLAVKITRNNGQTGITIYTFGFPLDTDELARMRGSKVTISAAVESGANWSPTSGTLNMALYVGTGAVAKRGGGFAGETNVVNTSVNLAVSTSGTLSATSAATVPTNTTQGEVQFTWTPVGTAGADDSITIDDVQLELGVFASTMERTPFEKMLAGCRRHFWKTFLYGTAPAQSIGVGTGEFQALAGKTTTGADVMPLRHPIQMRATPGTVTTYNPAAANAQVRDETAAGDCSATGTANLTSETITITATGNAGSAVGNTLGVHLTVDANI